MHSPWMENHAKENSAPSNTDASVLSERYVDCEAAQGQFTVPMTLRINNTSAEVHPDTVTISQAAAGNSGMGLPSVWQSAGSSVSLVTDRSVLSAGDEENTMIEHYSRDHTAEKRTPPGGLNEDLNIVLKKGLSEDDNTRNPFKVVMRDYLRHQLSVSEAMILALQASSQIRTMDLIEEAAAKGQISITGRAQQVPGRFGGKQPSTLVTLKVDGETGTTYHSFDSDLWRYGGRSTIAKKPEWCEVDSIEITASYGNVEAYVHTIKTEHSTCWSWRSDNEGLFRVLPKHIHIVEMICGYLNLAAGRDQADRVQGLFDLPEGYVAPSHYGRYLDLSFIRFSNRDSNNTNLVSTTAASTIEPEVEVEALSRINGSRMVLQYNIAQLAERIDTMHSAITATYRREIIDKATSGIILPSSWRNCQDGPCLCGDSLMVFDTRTNQVRALEVGTEQYLAISYVWTQHDESTLVSYIHRAVKEIGVCLVWVDRLCINQRCEQHKAKQIPHMREVYQQGYATVALIPDVAAELPSLLWSPLAILPKHKFEKLTRAFCAELGLCAWRTRC